MAGVVRTSRDILHQPTNVDVIGELIRILLAGTETERPIEPQQHLGTLIL